MAKSRKPTAARTIIDRPLGGTEKIYWLLDKLYSLNFAAYVQLDGTLEPDRLQTALSRIQEMTPLLRARIVVENKAPLFEPVEPIDYPLRLEIQSLRGWRRQLERHLDTPFPAGAAPLARVLWFRGKGAKSILAMLFHHPIADGRSGVHVLLQCLRQAANVAPPELLYRPARPPVQQLDLIRQKDPVAGKLKEVRFWLAKGREVLRMARQLPGYDMNATDRRATASIELTLSKRDTGALLAACRARTTSIHGALGAAQVMALHDEFPERKKRVMALNSLADLRGVLSGNLTEQDLGLYVSTLTTVHTLEADPDFWGLAAEIRDELQSIISSGDADLIHSFYPGSALFTPDVSGARKVQRIVALAPPSSMLTNIGRVEEVDLGPALSVREAGFLLSPPAQYPICVTASSYRGGMLLNLLYDRNKIDQLQARRIAGHLLDHLREAARGRVA